MSATQKPLLLAPSDEGILAERPATPSPSTDENVGELATSASASSSAATSPTLPSQSQSRDRLEILPQTGSWSKIRRLGVEGGHGCSEPRENWAGGCIERFDGRKPLVQVAPMLHVTDRHFRAFMRCLTHRAELWTEMIVESTLRFSDDIFRHLAHGGLASANLVSPVVCQLGGCDPEGVAAAAVLAAAHNYDRINLNVGCPSPRVAGKGCFGAGLMYDADLLNRIAVKTSEKLRLSPTPAVPFTIKTRIGVDDFDSDIWLQNWLASVSTGDGSESALATAMPLMACQEFVLHARKAILCKKLTPTENRRIPSLNYDRVFEMVKQFPELHFSINGGVQSLAEVENLLSVPHPSPARAGESAIYGVMIGRAARDNPAMLADTDRRIYGDKKNPATAETRRTVLEAFANYCDEDFRVIDRYDETRSHSPLSQSNGIEQKAPMKTHAHYYLKGINGLFHGTKASKLYRQTCDTMIKDKSSAPARIIDKIIALLETSPQAESLIDMPIVTEYEETDHGDGNGNGNCNDNSDEKWGR